MSPAWIFRHCFRDRLPQAKKVFCSQPEGIRGTIWTRYEYVEKPEFQAEFNCYLICKQRVSGSNPLVGSRF